MGDNLHEANNKRRNELINKLIVHNVFKKGNKQLFELTLRELEDEYHYIQKESHPHSDVGSIHWKTYTKLTS
ncbi:Fur-regulated basic protein FbpA [Bacillus sp. es.034]|jgi:Fur-regulated basic protein A|uniref:Fur-regulated basic protein FbpA n=1 Tax=Bacillus sp. es.034 TaxID=1761763 RepID=UPI000BF6171D|nr:Fur-regulated basic protein FbpA [Bacillus sp. es.034]PFG06429.1 Fur-regulated basic protein A [Bacillus sp. es.034]